jgi:hypothetical protein
MRKSTFFFLIVPLFLMLWSGCSKQEKVPAGDFENHPIYKHYQFSNDEKVIEIGVPTPWATVGHIVEVMKRDEILAEELARGGYSVKFYPFLKGDEINYFMGKGSLEGTIMGDAPTLKMAAEGRITVLSLFHKGSVSLVSRDVFRMKDLKNKRIAYPHGSVAHYYLLRLLKEKGMSEADIRHAPMDTSDMFEAIEQKRIDAFTTFEPTATVYTRLDPTLHTINRSFSSYGFFSVRKNYAAAHERAIRALLAAQFRARTWLVTSDRNRHLASGWVADESEKFMPLPLKKFIAELDALCAEDVLSMSDYAGVMKRDVLGDGGEMQREFEFLKEKGLISREREWKDVKANIDTRTLTEALKDRRHTASRVSP